MELSISSGDVTLGSLEVSLKSLSSITFSEDRLLKLKLEIVPSRRIPPRSNYFPERSFVVFVLRVIEKDEGGAGKFFLIL